MTKHVQVIVDGAVQFDEPVETIDFASILHDRNATELPCEMRVTLHYGHRGADGTIEVP
jgi:hypothetical protein